jgi:RNA polymerase sigma-70 factor (ECF subfamily)
LAVKISKSTMPAPPTSRRGGNVSFLGASYSATDINRDEGLGLGRELDWNQALAEQIKTNGRLFYGLAHGLLRNSAAAEDVCQQALLKAWEQRDEIADPQSLRSWLCRVVVNESVRIYRRQKVESQAIVHGAVRQPAPAQSPDAAADVRESVTLALEQLPENVRQVIVLRLMEGLKGREVAKLLGVSPGTVSKKLFEGVDLLRQHLVDWDWNGNGGS